MIIYIELFHMWYCSWAKCYICWSVLI